MKSHYASIALPLLLVGIATLSGCGDVAPNANAQPAAVGRTASTAAPSDDWPGTYRARIESGKGDMIIEPASDGRRYDVSIAASGFPDGCGGVAEGQGTVSGNVLTLGIKADWLEGGTCQMTITRSGNRLVVANETCLGVTGQSCTVSGNYARIGAPKATAAPAATGSAWIVGAWAMKAEWCLGSFVEFKADGTYVSEGENGRWTLVGATLTTTATAETDLTEPDKPIANAKPDSVQIVSHTATRMRQRMPDGRLFTLIRCPISRS